MRDNTLKLVIDEKEVTADQYFEHCLTLLEGNDEDIMRKNEPRRCIRKYFPKRHCFTFERPGNKKTLKILDELTDKDLDSQFVEDTNVFLSYVWNNCKPMAMQNGKQITGSSKFARLFIVLKQWMPYNFVKDCNPDQTIWPLCYVHIPCLKRLCSYSNS